MSESFDLKELSARVPSGAWSVFDMRGVVEIQDAGQKPIVHWSGFDQAGHAPRQRSRIAAFIVALVNAYRAGRLHTSEDLASAEAAAHAKGRAEGIGEAVKVVADLCPAVPEAPKLILRALLPTTGGSDAKR